jgi:hypothetical protein
MNRGLLDVLVLYGLTTAGVFIGLVRGRAPSSRLFIAPLSAIPIFLVAFIALSIMTGLLRHRLPAPAIVAI